MKKIALNKETLRKLNDGNLKNVAGGKYGTGQCTYVPGCYESREEPC